MQEAGATATQELAYTLADGIEYIRAALQTGLNIDQFAPRLSFFFGLGMNFFMEIAKLRAARVLWAELVQEQFMPNDPRSLMLRTHCQTSGVSLTSKDPYNNIVRTTVEALAGVLGGTQSLHTNSFDEALALPTKISSRIARNTQLILREEMGVTKVVDPLGGSYYVESLTANLVREARRLVREVEDVGGMTKAVISGMPKLRIEEASARRQARIDQNEELIIGVNSFQNEKETDVNILNVDNDTVRETQIAKLKRVRDSRNEARCQASLETLANAAEQKNVNLIKYAMEAARQRATLGEISLSLERVFGRYRAEIRSIAGVYGAMSGNDDRFAKLRNAANKFSIDHGRQPRILIAKLGQDGHDRGAKIIATAFADIGFDVDIGPLFQTPDEVVGQAIENDVHIIGISSQAGGHKSLVPKLIEMLRANGRSDMIVTVGGVIPPGDHKFLSNAGVAAIFGPGTPIMDSAEVVLKLLGDLR